MHGESALVKVLSGTLAGEHFLANTAELNTSAGRDVLATMQVRVSDSALRLGVQHIK